MTTNKRYGNLKNNNAIEYAPRSFVLDDGSVFIPKEDNDEAYFSHGWSKIVDERPEFDP